MESSSLNALIDEFETLVTKGSSIFGALSSRWLKAPGEMLGSQVRDWRPAWTKAQEIQDIFKSGVRYPTRVERDSAWTRFNNIRNELSQRNNADRERIFSVSKQWRDSILNDLKYAHYSKFSDVMFFFDPTTADEIKKLGEIVKEAGRVLSENKHQMLREHKDECFERMQEVRQSHDLFWGQYKKAREIRKQEHAKRISGMLARIEGNIASNLERKSKAQYALDRVEENISRLHGMLESARGDEFRGARRRMVVRSVGKEKQRPGFTQAY